MLLGIRATADAGNEVQGEPVNSRLAVRTDNLRVGLTAAVSVGTSLLIRTDNLTVGLDAPSPPRIAIPTGPMRIRASGSALRPIKVDLRVRLNADTAGKLNVRTGGLIVSLTAENIGFGFKRDIVIAAQPDLASVVLTDAVALGIVLVDNDFRSVANLGRITDPNAGDIEFRTGSTILSHNVVGYDPVVGVIVVDIRLPTWNPTQDYPIRMNYGGL